MTGESLAIKKRLHVLVLQVAIILTSCYLCQPAQGQMKYAVKAGMNFSNAKFENFESDFALRYHVGFLGTFNVSKYLALQTEVQYSQKGWNIPDDFYNKDVSITMHYISFPILLQYTWNERFALATGTEISYNLGTQRKPTIDGWVDFYEPWDIGVLASVRYHIRPAIAAELRYVHGLSVLFKGDLRDPNNVPLGSYKEGKNRVFQLGMVYYLH